MSKRKPKDRSREILERIVGTRSKTYLAEAFKLAFAEKYDVKREEIKQGIVDKVYNQDKIIKEAFTSAQMKKAKEFDFRNFSKFKEGDLVTWDGKHAVLSWLEKDYVSMTIILKNGTEGKLNNSWTRSASSGWRSTNNTRSGWER